jgi:hypothetical protein
MDKLIYNTITEDGFLKSVGPYRTDVTNGISVNQSYVTYSPTIIKRVEVKGIEQQTLTKKA